MTSSLSNLVDNSYKESIKLNIKILIVFLNMRKFDMRKVEKTNMRKFKAQFDKT